MRLSSLLLPFMLLYAGAALAAEPAKPLTTHLAVAAAVDGAGRVVSLDFASDALPDAVRIPLARAMRAWEFEPARVDGVAVPSVTHLAVTVLAEPLDAAGDAYALRITRATNGPRLLDTRPPRYPPEAIRSRTSANLLLDVQFDAAGAVTDVSLDSVLKRRGSARHLKLLVEAALQSVRTWTFVPEQVRGQPVAAQVQVPMRFCVGPDRGNGTCFEEDPGDAPLPPPASGQQLIAANPVARLKTEVVGQVL